MTEGLKPPPGPIADRPEAAGAAKPADVDNLNTGDPPLLVVRRDNEHQPVYERSAGKSSDFAGVQATMSSLDLPQYDETERRMTPGARIHRARLARQWSLQQLALHMRLYAAKRGDPAPGVLSLKPMISRWEHDKAKPDEYNRRLLAAVLQVTVADLDLPEDPDFIWNDGSEPGGLPGTTRMRPR
ncbi:hypothetical protein Ato02nite_074970 [Paractinoplanes toevensis]|uniref:HTH cro/C1-type domain-containing protein n=1 Tax=Paractinoplanes toevensis TaxID=571911 RepID=A0A919W5K9_9ACTN|nr:hypothetical protein Ato02nite_074970 [Actinoplanes toevensis]